MEMTELQKIRQLQEIWGKGYSKNLNTAKKAIGRYQESDGFLTNGFWAFPKKFEPKLFSELRAEKTQAKIKEKFGEVIVAEKQKMTIIGLEFTHSGLKVKLEAENKAFVSYIDPKYLTVLNNLSRVVLQDVTLWQEDALAPLLIDNKDNTSLLIIMPVRI